MQYVPPRGSLDPNADYIGGDPSSSLRGSYVAAGAIENPMREVCNAITLSGQTPDPGDLTQLWKAMLRAASLIHITPFSGNSTLYVLRGGSGDGLSAGSPLPSIAAAFDKINSNLIPAGSTITIKLLSPDTYPGPVVWNCETNVIVLGDVTAREAYIITGGNGGGLGGVFNTGGGGTIVAQGVTLQNTSSNYGTIFTGQGAFWLDRSAVACTLPNSVGHFTGYGMGSIVVLDCHVSGNVGYLSLGRVSFGVGSVLTLVGTPAWAFAGVVASEQGNANIGCTWSGAATGKRFVARENGVIQTFGAGVNYIPGDVAGIESNGGLYV